MNAIIQNLVDADRAATLAVNAFGGMFTDAVMPWVSNRAVWIPFYLLLVCYLWLRLGWKKTLLILVVAVLSVAAVDQLANLVKYSVCRFRPCWDEYMVDNGLKILERKGGKYGFFSGHASTCAALATSVLYLYKDKLLKVILPLWVALVSLSRVYVGKHFLGDILVGALVGILVALVISYFMHFVLTKYFAKFVD